VTALAAFGSRRHRGKQQKRRRGLWILAPLFGLCVSPVFMAVLPSSQAKAGSYTADAETRDFFFTFTEPQTFTVRTYAQQYGIDSMLWLYDSSNTLVSANDDFFGLDSNISIQVSAGQYRLRAGVCCGNPDAWYGSSYLIEASVSGVPETSSPSTTTTTTIAPYFNVVRNLTAEPSSDGSVFLSWDMPEPSNISPYGYDITFYDLDEIGGTAFGGWGVWTNEGTSYSLETWMFSGSNPVTTGYGPVRFAVRAMSAGCVGQSNDPCLYGPQSAVDANVLDPTPPTTTSTSTTTTTTTVAPTTTIIIPPIITTTTTTTTSVAPTTSTSTTTASTTTSTTTTSTTTTEPPVATTTQTTSPQTTVPVTTTTTTQTTPTTTLPPIEEKTLPSSEAISTIGTPEKLAQLISTANLKEISATQAVALITNPVFLQLEDTELKKVFESIPISSLTDEQEIALVTSLSSAPSSVKETFETTVDIYGSGLDKYVPNGSAVDVGTRRSLIAVTTVLSSVAATGAGTLPSGGGNNTPSGDANQAARKENEDPEDEEAGGLEGPENREKNENTRNSIFTYGENNMKKFSIIGFIKKFMKETAALSFTFAGSAIMFVTLSGDTQRIAIIATVAAVTVHYISVMLENDSE
jgi:hypothetical protein